MIWRTFVVETQRGRRTGVTLKTGMFVADIGNSNVFSERAYLWAEQIQGVLDFVV